jgi:hypothetical protein
VEAEGRAAAAAVASAAAGQALVAADRAEVAVLEEAER